MARITLLVAGAGLGATTALTFTAETAGQLRAPGGPATFAGSLTGMTGTYLALMMVLLISRIPVIGRVLGQDGLLRWHRRLAPWPISLLVAHAAFITVGAAQAARNGLGRQAGVMLTQLPLCPHRHHRARHHVPDRRDLPARDRSRLSREAWWLVHLYMYLALALSLRTSSCSGRPSSGTRSPGPCGRSRGPPRLAWCSSTASACRWRAACATGWW